MSIEIKMPALSPTMEEGTLAKWLVGEGDQVRSGDIMAEIETDKATMEFEAVDEGIIARILVAAGTDGVKVGAPIAILLEEGEDAAAASAPTGTETLRSANPASEPHPSPADPNDDGSEAAPVARTEETAEDHGRPDDAGAEPAADRGGRVGASPLARRLAAERGIDLAVVAGSGPNGRIVRADLDRAAPSSSATRPAAAPPAAPQFAAPQPAAARPVAVPPAAPAPAPAAKAKPVSFDETIPHRIDKLSNIRKTIARRLTESKQQVPHIYLTVDVRLDALLTLRGELNHGLAGRGIKLSVNDLLIKALGVALAEVPTCNVTFAGDRMVTYERADVSVAVSTPSGLITPIIRDAANASISSISARMKDLGARAKDNRLKPEEYQGGTASLSNMGMFGIKQFDAVINPPQGMILAVGAGEQRPHVIDGALGIATMMTATGSFDHRAIDGADGAKLMKAFRALVEAPFGLLA